MRLALGSVLGIALIGSLGFYIYERTRPSARDCNNLTIVAFGDSLVTGYGTQPGEEFVARVASELSVPIENLGKNGDTTASARARVDEVLSRNPDIVILLLGGNDALRRTSAEETKQNLEAIISSLRAKEAQVVLLGVVGGFPDPYADIYTSLAKKYEATLVPNVLAGLITNPKLMSDSIHPNSEGHARIAERVIPSVMRACGKFAD